MGSTTFRKRDLSRFMKVYPFVRRTPKWGYVSDRPTIMETARLVFSSQSSITYTFLEDGYMNVPTVTAISVQTESGPNGADVNVYVTAISRYSVTIESSEAFTGEVDIQVIYVEC